MSPSSVTVHSAPWIETSLSRKNHGISYDLPFLFMTRTSLANSFLFFRGLPSKTSTEGQLWRLYFWQLHTLWILLSPYRLHDLKLPFAFFPNMTMATWEQGLWFFFFICESQSYNACLKHSLNKVFQKGEKILQGLTNSWRIKAHQWRSEHGTWFQILYQDFYLMLQWEDPCDMRNF